MTSTSVARKRLEEFHSGETLKSTASSGFRRLELPILFLHENVQGFRWKALKEKIRDRETKL